MKSSKCLLISTLILCCLQLSQAYDNNPPIPERHPGWTTRGKVDSQIEFEAIYDLLCSGSAF